ncbi:hypothetical protein D0867_16172, partial [Hortaea werneckii]
ISSYFTKDPGTAASVRVDAPTSLLDEKNSSCVLPTWPDDESFPSPDAEGLVDSIMCRLMAQLYACLEPRFNSAILRLLESYRCMNDERQKLQQQFESEVKRGTLLYQRLQAAQKQWSDERQDFKAEIKRLELLLAKGKRGIAEVTLAREDSELRRKESVRRSRGMDDGLETIFEFLEKTRRWEDKAYGSQRGMNAAHFGCASDLFEYENVNVNLTNASGTDNDVVAVQRIAHVLARRRNIDTKDVMPKLLTLFDAVPPTSIDSEGFAGSPNNEDFNRPDSPIISDRLYAPIRKEPSLMRKASGLLSKLRTQIGTENSVPAKRSFSFEAGDDAAPVGPLWLTEASSRRAEGSQLRESVSVSSLAEIVGSIGKSQAGGSTSSGSSAAAFERSEYVNQALALRDNAFAAAHVKDDDTGATPCLALTQPGSIRCYHQPPGYNAPKGSLYETGHPSDAVIAKENIHPTASLHSHEG